jgi:leucyl/phenylalanyl-tRNA---protein transferase
MQAKFAMSSQGINSEKLLLAYQNGFFPMADDATDTDFYWVDPDMRGQLPILDLHIPARLKRTILKSPYRVTINTAFADVIDACAASTPGRETTWINASIRDAFIDLHAQGRAHSVEVWHDMELIGGVYGLSLGQIFCGESMFSRVTDASKIALVHLCARLWAAGFHVLDTQFTNDHLAQFGVYEIPRLDYHQLLATYADQPADFTAAGDTSTLIERYFAARSWQG